MWFLISGVWRKKLPWWFLASSETWNEAFKTFLHHNYKADMQEVKERTAVTAISEIMNDILITVDTETEGGYINHNYKLSYIQQAVCFGFK